MSTSSSTSSILSLPAVTMTESLDDSGISLDNDSPFPSTRATSITTDASSTKFSKSELISSEEVPECSPTLLDPENTIQQAFIMATSGLSAIENDIESFRSRASSSSSEESVDVEKTFDLGPNLPLDPAAQLESGRHLESHAQLGGVDSANSELQQLMPLDSSMFAGSMPWSQQGYGYGVPNQQDHSLPPGSSTICGRQSVDGNQEMIWQSMQKDGIITQKTQPELSPIQNIFFPGNHEQAHETDKPGLARGQRAGHNQASSVQCPVYMKAITPYVPPVPASSFSVGSEASVPGNYPNTTTEQAGGAWNAQLQQREHQLELRIAQASLQPFIQARIHELWKLHKRRMYRMEAGFAGFCTNQKTSSGMLPLLSRFFQDQHCAVVDVICGLLDEVLAGQGSKADRMQAYPVGSCTVPSYQGYGFDAANQSSYAQYVQLPAVPSSGSQPRLHVISPTGKNDAESNYSSKACVDSKGNVLYPYENHSEYERNVCTEALQYAQEDRSNLAHYSLHMPSGYHQMTTDTSPPMMQCSSNIKSASMKRSPISQTSRKLKSEAIEIMNIWFKNHIKHPYPSPETSEKIANACNITVGQVKKWFANKRMRTRNTKSLHDIALARRHIHESTVRIDPTCNMMTDSGHGINI